MDLLLVGDMMLLLSLRLTDLLLGDLLLLLALRPADLLLGDLLLLLSLRLAVLVDLMTLRYVQTPKGIWMRYICITVSGSFILAIPITRITPLQLTRATLITIQRSSQKIGLRVASSFLDGISRIDTPAM